MPQVSIIVPNFNHARFLEKRLDSIFGQTVQDFELIFLDDASTDNSLDVFEHYADDERVTCLVNQTNSGSPFVQWNKGFELATGQYIWIAESDDFAKSTFLETMISALEQHPTAGLASCLSYSVDDLDQNDGVFDVYHWFRDYRRWQQGYFNTGVNEIENYLSIQNTIPNASATLLRSKLIGSGLRAAEDMALAGDLYFWVTLLMDSDICHIGQPLNYFRKAHAASQRSRTEIGGQEIFESFKVYDLITNGVKLGKRQKFRAQRGLLRRWFSIATRCSLSFRDNYRIYSWFLMAESGSILLKIAQIGLSTLVLLLLPFTLIPGFKRFAAWGRGVVTDAARNVDG